MQPAKILKKENPRDPFTRELIPQYFINKYGDKPFKFRGRELNEHFGDLYLDLSGLNLTDEDLDKNRRLNHERGDIFFNIKKM